MAILKTKQSVESSKYLNSSRRRSSFNNLLLSINPIVPCAKNILRKLGSSCSFLSGYISNESPLKWLHATYCDFDNKVKVLWLNKPEKENEKEIECRR